MSVSVSRASVKRECVCVKRERERERERDVRGTESSQFTSIHTTTLLSRTHTCSHPHPHYTSPTPTHSHNIQVKFMLLHVNRNDDAIKNFFGDVYELYVKVLLNPFSELGQPSTSEDFRNRVKSLIKKNL